MKAVEKEWLWRKEGRRARGLVPVCIPGVLSGSGFVDMRGFEVTGGLQKGDCNSMPGLKNLGGLNSTSMTSLPSALNGPECPARSFPSQE